MFFAAINNGIVVNILIADSKETAEQITGLTCIPSNTAGIGWSYDDETGEFTAPALEELQEIKIEQAALSAGVSDNSPADTLDTPAE